MLYFEKTTLYVFFFSGSWEGIFQPCGKPSGINQFEFQFSVSTTENFIPELRTRSKTMRHITAFRREKEVSQARNSYLVHFVARELPFETCPTESIEKAGTRVANESEFCSNAKHQWNLRFIRRWRSLPGILHYSVRNRKCRFSGRAKLSSYAKATGV